MHLACGRWRILPPLRKKGQRSRRSAIALQASSQLSLVDRIASGRRLGLFEKQVLPTRQFFLHRPDAVHKADEDRDANGCSREFESRRHNPGRDFAGRCRLIACRLDAPVSIRRCIKFQYFRIIVFQVCTSALAQGCRSVATGSRSKFSDKRKMVGSRRHRGELGYTQWNNARWFGNLHSLNAGAAERPPGVLG